MENTLSNRTPPASALSPLTGAERCAALAWIDRGEDSLRQVAAQLGLAADELLDILTQPHVAAFVEAAETILQIRRNILARYEETDARQSLVEIAKNPEADHTTRLRAAIAILQGPPPRRALAPNPTAPTGPGSPSAPGGPQPGRSTSARPTPSGAQPPDNHAAPTSTDSRPTDPPSPPAPTTNTPARLNRAAGAPFAHRDRIADQPAIRILPGASPAASGRPP